jgi:hypothetical protein
VVGHCTFRQTTNNANILGAIPLYFNLKLPGNAILTAHANLTPPFELIISSNEFYIQLVKQFAKHPLRAQALPQFEEVARRVLQLMSYMRDDDNSVT